MNNRPIAIELPNPQTLRIKWDDGRVREYSVESLRAACPCATCREKRRAEAKPVDLLPVLSIEEARPTEIVAMKPIGNYAYGIHFNDGHDTGIFTLEFLRKLDA